jgi:hypothetical protein
MQARNYALVFFAGLADTATSPPVGGVRNSGGRVALAAVVPCTDSKFGGGPGVALRDVNAGLSRHALASTWLDRIGAARPHGRARELYKGPGWTASLDLVVTLQAADAQLQWRIMSAGYGLLTPDTPVVRYSATFLAGHPDSVPGVGSDAGAAVDWWERVNRLRGEPQPVLALAREADGLLIAASAPYVDAVAPELLAVARHTPTVVFSAGRPRNPEVAALVPRFDRRLREGHDPFVRGGDVGFNQRVATRCVEHLGADVVDRARVEGVLADAMDREGPMRHDRRVATDAAVMAFIDAALTSDPSASRTALLRRWRDQGRACEQRRFGVLYERVVAERDGQLTLGEAAYG